MRFARKKLCGVLYLRKMFNDACCSLCCKATRRGTPVLIVTTSLVIIALVILGIFKPSFEHI